MKVVGSHSSLILHLNPDFPAMLGHFWEDKTLRVTIPYEGSSLIQNPLLKNVTIGGPAPSAGRYGVITPLNGIING